MTASDLSGLNTAVDRLMGQLADKQEQLRRCELSCGMGHDLRKMIRLREEIASLNTRLVRAERLQDAALTAPAPSLTPGLTGYHSEMGEQRPPTAQIDASLGHYGKHYFLKTPLTLSGRGVEFLETFTAESLTPQAQDKVGWHRYKVTIAAFEKICKQYHVASEMLLS